MNTIFKILIIDIEQERNILKKMLMVDDTNIEIDEAVDGDSAIAILSKNDFNCIIMDFKLPGLIGMQFIKLVRSKKIEIPIIILTAQGNEEIAVKLIKAGAADYLVKGKVTPEKLIETIRNTASVAISNEHEEALKKSLNNFKKMFDDFPTLIWIADQNGKCNYVNKVWLEFTGKNMEQAFGDGWDESVYPEDIERCRKAYGSAFSTKEHLKLEYRLRRFDGKYRWITENATPFYNIDGEFVGFIGSCNDTTERKWAFARNLLLQEMSTKVFSNKPIEKILQFICDKLVYIYGFTSAWVGYKELDGTISYKASTGKIKDALLNLQLRWDDISSNPIASSLQSGQTQVIRLDKCHFEPCRRVGQELGIKENLLVPLIVNGDALGIICLSTTDAAGFEDEEIIHIQRIANQVAVAWQATINKIRLTETEQLYKSIFDSNSDAIFSLDLDGQFITMNTIAEELCGCSLKEIQSEKCLSIETEQLNQFKDKIKLTFQGSPQNFDYKLVRKDGSIIYINVTMVPIRMNGKIVGAHGIARDISEEIRSKEIWQRYQLLSDYIHDIILMFDLKGNILEANEAAVKTYGYSKEELLTLSLNDIREIKIFDTNHLNGELSVIENIHRRKDGTTFQIEAYIKSAVIGSEKVCVAIIRNINERMKLEAHSILFQEVAVKVLEEKPIDEILTFLCQRLAGNFDIQIPLNWVGFKEKDGRISVQASSGIAKKILDVSELRWDANRCPSGTAIALGKTILATIDDINYTEWFKLAQNYGILAVAAFPLQVKGKTLGVLSMGTHVKDFFTHNIITNLQNFAGQIAIAMQAALRNNQLLMQETALQSIANATLIINDKGIVERVNYAFSNLTGYKPGEIIGNSVEVLKPDKYDFKIYKNIFKSLLQGKVWKGEIENKRKDGSLFLCEISITPIQDTSFKTNKFICTVEDVTERKEAEKKLKQERQRLFTLLEELPVSVSLVAPDHTLHYANRYFRNQIGSLIEKDKCFQLMYEEHPCEKCYTQEVFRTKKPQKWERAFQEKTYQMYGYPFYETDGTLLVMELAIDITERKQVEELLQRYQILSDLVSDVILMMKPDGTIIEANKATEVIYGYTRNELLGMKISKLREPQTLALVEKQMAKAHTSGILFETIHVRQDGKTFPVEVSAKGAILGNEQILVSIVRDISKRKLAEQEMLDARERAERAERLASLGTMAAGIAHEINQPLNSLKVTADGMLYWHNKGKQQDIEKVIQNIEKISKQASRIDEIIKHMRSFVKSDFCTELSLCNLNDSIEGALNMLGNQLRSHGIEVVKELQVDLPLIFAVMTRLEEVVINLLVNALQAFDAFHHREKIIICRTYCNGKSIFLEIEDNGPGIAEQVREKIFEPFFTTKKVGEGMGLGLSIVHSIVSSFNGEILVINGKLGGVIFKVKFPVMDN